MKIIAIIFIILIFGLTFIGYANRPKVQNPIHELRQDRIEEMYDYKNMIGIFCIDGYKWILTSGGAVQAFRIDSKGNSVLARCDE